jgi:hypothetical protein
MSGGGIGGALGAGAGMLLAPETGGMSLALPALLGAAGGAGGAALSGGNPLVSGLEGGAGGLAGGFLSGLLSPAADVGTAAGDIINPLDVADTSDQAGMGDLLGTPSLSGMQGTPASAIPSSVQIPGAGSSGSSGGGISDYLSSLNPFGDGSGSSSAANTAASGAASKAGGNSLSDYLLPAGLGLGVLGAFMPSGSNPTSVTGTAGNVAAANPGFTSSLPTYKANVTQTPYQGSWYSYGLRPETPMVQSTLTPTSTPITYSSPAQQIQPLAQGGMVRHFAPGGHVRPIAALQIPMSKMPVRKFAMGGINPPMQPPTGVPPQMGASPMPMQAPPPMARRPDPHAQAAQFQMGQKLGQALRQHIKGTPPGRVHGPGKGQDDAIPAKLSADEYVVPADITSALGDGSSKAGGKELDKMVHAVRAHKTSKGADFPPRAKSPLEYIGRG